MDFGNKTHIAILSLLYSMHLFPKLQSLLEGISALPDPEHLHPPPIDIDQQWNNLLSMPVTDLDVSCLLAFTIES